MRIANKKSLIRGVLLLASFIIMLSVMLMPVIPGSDGEKLTGLEYADEVFNELSKGSSYFIPLAEKAAKEMEGKNTHLVAPLTSERQAEMARTLLKEAGLNHLAVEGDKLAFWGDLGKILSSAVQDSDLMYNNDGKTVREKYNGANPLEVMSAWWHLLNPCIRELQKQKLLDEANAVDQVLKRAVEPGNNFYGIPAEKVSSNLLLLSGLLLFYIFYTTWYGFGIYEIFDGLGFMGVKEEIEIEEESEI